MRNYQTGEGPLGSDNFDGLDIDQLKNRVGQMHPETWKLRRDKFIAHTQKIYEEKIKNNQFLTSHDLLGFIDRKLSNPFSPGEVFIEMSKSFIGKGPDGGNGL